MIILRTQFEIIQIALLKQQHNNSIAYDSNAKYHESCLNKRIIDLIKRKQ